MNRSLSSIIHEDYYTNRTFYKTYFVYGRNMYKNFDKWILNQPRNAVRIVKRGSYVFRLSWHNDGWTRKIEAKLPDQTDSQYELVHSDAYLH